MLRILALLVIVLGSGAYGLMMAQRHTMRPKQLRSFHQALEALETEISYGATPLPQALEIAASGLDHGVGQFFIDISRRISGGETASEAWQSTCQEMAGDFNLNSEEWKIIRYVGIGLGTKDRLEEKKKLKIGCQRLMAAEEKALEQSAKLAKMWSYMGFLTGAAIALVIL